MGILEQFKINLKGLKEQKSTFSFHLDIEYFDAIGATEVKGGTLSVALEVCKVANAYELDFHVVGNVAVTCDLCLDDMFLPVETSQKVLARLGQMDAEDDDVIIVAEDEGVVDVAWLIYEFIALSLPTKHVHAEGHCNPDMMKRLQQLTAQVEEEKDFGDDIDPRWSKLKELKSIIKE